MWCCASLLHHWLHKCYQIPIQQRYCKTKSEIHWNRTNIMQKHQQRKPFFTEALVRQLSDPSLATAKPEFGSCRTWDWQLPSCNQWWSLSHRTSKRTYNKISHQEPEPPPLPVWALLGVDLQAASLHITRYDGYTKMDFMPNPCHFRSCKDPRCKYLAADKWDYCCGKCQHYFETFGFDIGRPKKKHCNDCWRVYV